MSIWGGCAGGGGGEEARAYSYANGCGEGCKAQEPSSPPEKVGALSPAHSWGLAGLERIRTHIGKASSFPQSSSASPFWIQRPHFLPHPVPGKGHLAERSPLRRGLWGGPGAPCSCISQQQGPGGRDAGIAAPAGTACVWRPQRLSRQLGSDVTSAPGRSGPRR